MSLYCNTHKLINGKCIVCTGLARHNSNILDLTLKMNFSYIWLPALKLIHKSSTFLLTLRPFLAEFHRWAKWGTSPPWLPKSLIACQFSTFSDLLCTSKHTCHCCTRAIAPRLHARIVREVAVSSTNTYIEDQVERCLSVSVYYCWLQREDNNEPWLKGAELSFVAFQGLTRLTMDPV